MVGQLAVERVDARDVAPIDVVAQVVSLEAKTVPIHPRTHVTFEHLPTQTISPLRVHRKQLELEIPSGLFRSVAGVTANAHIVSF